MYNVYLDRVTFTNIKGTNFVVFVTHNRAIELVTFW